MTGADLDSVGADPGRVIALALSVAGTPYRHQAALAGVGCDCLGLVRLVWRGLHGHEAETPPPYAAGGEAAAGEDPEALIAAARRHLILVETPRPGDVLAYRWRPHQPVRHLAILTAADRMIHAQDGAGVVEVAFGPWWRRRLAAAFRFPAPLSTRPDP
jgi:NlpC/P60 family putative phage cell wall peptidase